MREFKLLKNINILLTFIFIKNFYKKINLFIIYLYILYSTRLKY